jgi:homoserine dehydrogenase
VSALVRNIDRQAPSTLNFERDGAAVLNCGPDVIVEALGGLEPARTLVAAALDRGIPVVTANKSLLAAHGPELRARARLAGVPLLYEAAVVAGVPFVGALANRPGLRSLTKITGILNGTSHAIACAIERGVSFEDALADATARGYAEPDSSADVSGRDAAEKLAILLQLCGAPDTTAADIERTGIDALRPEDFAAARAQGGVIKPIATATFGPGGWAGRVGPAVIPQSHLFATLSGVTNALELQPAVGAPITFIGPGAGPAITAQTILDDVVQAVRER